MSEPIDTSAEVVDMLATFHESGASGQPDIHTAEVLRALAAERDAAVARASEHGAYRTAASAFLASRGLLGEFDAWCAERGMPADAVGALVEVARAARAQRESASAVSSMIGHRPGPERQSAAKDLGAANRELWAALDALPSGILDHSEG